MRVYGQLVLMTHPEDKQAVSSGTMVAGLKTIHKATLYHTCKQGALQVLSWLPLNR